MKKHRNAYYPVMKRLLALHGTKPGAPVEVTELPEMLVVLELLDIGHCDPESFIVKERFGEVRALYYTGGFPFLEKGMEFLYHRWRALALRRGAIAAAILLGLALIAAVW